MDCAFKLEKHINAYEKVIRLATFNVYSHNRDDHSKNFAFLMEDTGKWEMSPAYDLTFSESFNGMHSTMVAGESREPGKKQLLELANYFGVKNTETIIENVKDVIAGWNKYAADCGVTTASRNQIGRVFNSYLKK